MVVMELRCGCVESRDNIIYGDEVDAEGVVVIVLVYVPYHVVSDSTAVISCKTYWSTIFVMTMTAIRQ